LKINALAQLFVQQWVDVLVAALAAAQPNPDVTLDDLENAIVGATSQTQSDIL
jgi:hypothetical protein